MEPEGKVIAFVLLVSDSSSTEETFLKLQEMENIEEVHLIYGDYDLILKVKLNNLHEMTNFMMKLRNNFDIKKSNTLITLSS